MLDAIERQRGRDGLRVLDVCCGPGSLTQKVLARFPDATVVAVDLDPWLIELGRHTVTDPATVTWIEADVSATEWVSKLPAGSFDAAVSATALHWLSTPALAQLYESLAVLLAPGGAFLNADHFPTGSGPVDTLSWSFTQARQADVFGAGQENYQQFWDAVAAISAFQPLVEEQQRRFAGRPPHHRTATPFHREALVTAGFSSVGEIWRYHDDAILLALR
jgi:ubiquinone/menaquinone biosynthesis C-methylase UbiE